MRVFDPPMERNDHEVGSHPLQPGSVRQDPVGIDLIRQPGLDRPGRFNPLNQYEYEA